MAYNLSYTHTHTHSQANTRLCGVNHSQVADKTETGH